MPEFVEGQIRYDFPEGFSILRLEDSTYYAKHWQHFAEQNGGAGNKECDCIAFDPKSKTLWLIEVKDYRAAFRTKPSELTVEFAQKCRDAVGCLFAMKLSRLTQDEDKNTIHSLIKAVVVRCVLHVEQGVRSRLFPQIIDPKTLKDLTRNRLRPLDPHALGGDADVLNSRVPWGIAI
jgi:hypothetical protein